MSFVLLQTQAGADMEDCVIELSSRQAESLGDPHVVRIERMAGSKSKKPGMRMLCQVKANSELSHDGCRLSLSTLKIVGVAASDCVRLSLLPNDVGSQQEEGPEALAVKMAQQEMRESLVVSLQEALATLAHERDW